MPLKHASTSIRELTPKSRETKKLGHAELVEV